MSESMPELLSGAEVDPAVWETFPDYTAVVMVVQGLRPGPPTDASEELLRSAEARARVELQGWDPHELPEVATWRAAYAEFGVKPRQARSSVEGLLRRVDPGLPRIDRLTDTYNAISVLHRTPIGGENASAYLGPPRLVVADGSETFDTVRDGEAVEEPIPVGEIVWRDDHGVTCRRWNWRQCVRTRLDDATTTGLFIVDALGEDSAGRAATVADALVSALRADSPECSSSQVMLTRT